MKPADQVLYGPDMKLCFVAVCYTDDVSYEHVGYRQVDSLNVDRLRTASRLCSQQQPHHLLQHYNTVYISSALYSYCLAFVCLSQYIYYL